MSKIVVTFEQESTSAAPNAYLMPDGLANIDKITTLGARVIEAMDKSAEDLEVNGYYYILRKAKPVRHSAAKAEKSDLKYLTQRAVKIMFRVRPMTETGLVRYKMLMPFVRKGLSPALQAQVKVAASALNQHIRKSETVKGKVTKTKQAIRKDDQKAFQVSLKVLKKHLTEGGIKEADMIESSSMFGVVLLVKLDAGDVVQVGRSDIAKFRAAKRAASAE